MGRYRVSGKARKMQIISLFRDVMFVSLTGVVWFRGDLGGRKAWIFIHKHGMFPSLQKKYHYTCPYLSFHPWSFNLFFGVFWILNRLFLEVPWSFWDCHHVRNCWNKSFQQFRNGCFFTAFRSRFIRRFVRVGKTLRLSNGTPWERQLWILLRGGGREMDLFTLSQVSWKVSHHRWGGATPPWN